MRPIQSTDPTGHFLLERWPRRARRAIPVGALIVVEDGEVAVLLDDRAAGPRVFPAGHHPIDEATGSALVVFLRSLPTEFLWGSAEPIQPVGSACGFRAHGTLRAAIADPGRAALASALAEALLDRPAALARAQRGRARFLGHFTIDRAADGMADFYRRALQPCRGD